MEIILTTDIKGVGFKNDLITVKPGFGRNYLIPQGLAVIANQTNKKVLAENVKQAAHKAEKLKTAAQSLAASIGDTVLEIQAKVGESGKIFGAVTTLQISDALKAKGFDVDRRKISLDSDVKNVGEYTATIDIHKEVQHKVKFVVVAA
jgi:large subunit ribosomal protein L9